MATVTATQRHQESSLVREEGGCRVYDITAKSQHRRRMLNGMSTRLDTPATIGQHIRHINTFGWLLGTCYHTIVVGWFAVIGLMLWSTSGRVVNIEYMMA